MTECSARCRSLGRASAAFIWCQDRLSGVRERALRNGPISGAGQGEIATGVRRAAWPIGSGLSGAGSAVAPTA
jgi:hypothetical protein